jgi:adenosylcobinamide-phosphate synthase
VSEILQALSPHPLLLVLGVAADLAFGDPVYAWHPIRLIGRLLTWMEARLRAVGLDGYGGGIFLFIGLSVVVLAVSVAIVAAAVAVSAIAAAIVHLFVVYSLLALGDLVHHVRRIESAVQRGDLPAAREAVSLLVGRDTDRMDAAACRRAAVESLSENLTDGFMSPVLWYAIAGLPGLTLFKIVSTMDSMVGYKTPRYLKFGWCGARLDDVLNYVPARLTWLLIAIIAAVLPRFSGRKAWSVGLHQHALLLGPNSGWSEAGTAGALERRIVGPIWLKGSLVTDLWIGDPSDPPLADANDMTRALILAVTTALVAVAIACVVLW